MPQMDSFGGKVFNPIKAISAVEKVWNQWKSLKRSAPLHYPSQFVTSRSFSPDWESSGAWTFTPQKSRCPAKFWMQPRMDATNRNSTRECLSAIRSIVKIERFKQLNCWGVYSRQNLVWGINSEGVRHLFPVNLPVVTVLGINPKSWGINSLEFSCLWLWGINS